MNLDQMTALFLGQLSHSLTEKEAKRFMWRIWQDDANDAFSLRISLKSGKKVFHADRLIPFDFSYRNVGIAVRDMVDKVRESVRNRNVPAQPVRHAQPDQAPAAVSAAPTSGS